MASSSLQIKPATFIISKLSSQNSTVSENTFTLTNPTNEHLTVTEVTTNIPNGVTLIEPIPSTIEPKDSQNLVVHFQRKAIGACTSAGFQYHIRIQYYIDGCDKAGLLAYIQFIIDWLPKDTPMRSMDTEHFSEEVLLCQDSSARSHVRVSLTATGMLDSDKFALVNMQILMAIIVLLFGLILLNGLMEVLFFSFY